MPPSLHIERIPKMDDFLIWFGKNMLPSIDTFPNPEKINKVLDLVEPIYNNCAAYTNSLYYGTKNIFSMYMEYINDYIHFTLLKYIVTYHNNKNISLKNFTEYYIHYPSEDNVKHYYENILKFFKNIDEDCLYQNQIIYYSNWINYKLSNNSPLLNKESIIRKNIYTRSFHSIKLFDLEKFYSLIFSEINNSNILDNVISNVRLEEDFSITYYKFLINEINQRKLYSGKSSTETNTKIKDLSILFNFPQPELQQNLILRYLNNDIERSKFIQHSAALKYLIFPYIKYYCMIYISILEFKGLLNDLNPYEDDIPFNTIHTRIPTKKDDEKIFNLINKYIYERKSPFINIYKDLYNNCNGNSINTLYSYLKELLHKVIYYY